MQKITFPHRVGFYETLKTRVNAYFEESHRPKTGDWRMFLKSAIILTWFFTSYILLVFFTSSFLMAAVNLFLFSQALVLIGFNIMHDGGHESYSRHRKLNRLMGFSMDLIGGSSFLWRTKHNILHHTYTNIEELDNDLHTNGLLRLSPRQEWRPWHRFQHWYALPVYSLLTLSWVAFADYEKFFKRKISEYSIRGPKKSEATLFFAAKVAYFGYMLVLPMFFHPVAYVLIGFLAMHLIVGLTTSVVFQLAHVVEGCTFPEPDSAKGTIDNEWAVHEVETTANFARRNKIACWYMGGLNFQIEHHLFTRICHVHYPAISKIVEETCKEFEVSYVSFPTVRAAIGNHMRFLKELGRHPAPAGA